MIVMDAGGPRRLTAEEYRQGFTICPCGKFAYIFRASLIAKLPRGYSGELCPECSLWMCDVEKLQVNQSTDCSEKPK